MISELDSEGYKTVAKSFNSGGYVYDFIEQLDENWRIYSVKNPRNNNQIFDYELVKFTKSEEYVLGESVIAKRWNYPTANAFGRNGFSLPSVKSCHRKHAELLQRAAEKSEVHEPKSIQLPAGEEFTLKDLSAKIGVDIPDLSEYVKSLKEKVQKVGEKKNPRGRPSPVYVFTP